MHAEAMLFVNNDQHKTMERYPLLKQCVGADHHLGRAICDVGESLALLLCGHLPS